MAESRHGRRLDQPRTAGRRFKVEFDPDSFGRFSERLARFLGTGKFLFWQTLLVLIWITLNLTALIHHWDPYPFILLNLAFSTQAAYAAPLILLAQNRQDDRDRITVEEDRNRALQTRAGTEYLAREIAALRVAINEIATRDYLRGELEKIRQEIDALSAQLNPGEADSSGTSIASGPVKRRPKTKPKQIRPAEPPTTAEQERQPDQQDR